MKIKVIIEETISQEFEVEVTDLNNVRKEIKEKYHNGTLVLENPTVLEAYMGIVEKNGEVENWEYL